MNHCAGWHAGCIITPKTSLMKKIALLAGLALSLFTSFKSEAQVRVNIRIGAPVAQQSWYNNDDDYYYMPEQGVYYNVRRQCYVYPEGGSWLYAANLPARYGAYTYNSSRYYRVHDRAPFNRHNDYRRQYPVAYNNDGGNRGNDRYNNGRRDNSANNGYGNSSDRDRNYGNGSSGNWNNSDNGSGRQGGNSTHYNRR